jgi:hypothetical protein
MLQTCKSFVHVYLHLADVDACINKSSTQCAGARNMTVKEIAMDLALEHRGVRIPIEQFTSKSIRRGVGSEASRKVQDAMASCNARSPLHI